MTRVYFSQQSYMGLQRVVIHRYENLKTEDSKKTRGRTGGKGAKSRDSSQSRQSRDYFYPRRISTSSSALNLVLKASMNRANFSEPNC